jgi:predicted kinase
MGNVKTFSMLVGLPASGKSTFRSSSWWSEPGTDAPVVVSSDDYIEAIARDEGSTYDAVWSHRTAKLAQRWCEDTAAFAFIDGLDVVWDQTNLTVKSRASKLRMVPEGYKKAAYVFDVPDAHEHACRLERPGKTIPIGVLASMTMTFVTPSYDEGFDEVWKVSAVDSKFTLTKVEK